MPSRKKTKGSIQNRYPAGTYRLVAFVYILRALTIPASLILFGYGFFTNNQSFLTASLGPLVLFLITTFIFWAKADRVTCILCRTPLLKHLKCAKKKGQIPHIFGDRSLATAVSLVLRKRKITCQYCAERQTYFD